MTREAVKLIETGDTFPNMEFSVISGESIVVPQDLGKRWRVVLIYRGHW